MKKKFLANTFTAAIYQVIVLICGFILPRFILQAYGSEVNGLVTSITQFIAIISCLDLGVGAVVQANLYRPLAQEDMIAVSKIVVSSNRFFRKIAIILIVYVGLLLVGYPYFSGVRFEWAYICLLILILGIDSFARYYFGITNQLLLTADQRGYLTYLVQGVTLIVNLICAIILIQLGTGIHLVKLSTALIFLMRPMFYYFYVKKKYPIQHNVTYQEEPVQQKWNGFSQHVAAIVLDGTDVIVLTMFSTLANVSIYSVYHLVVAGIKQLLLSFTSGISPMLGHLWAESNKEKIAHAFGWVEWAIHTASTLVFGCALILIVPFVQVYTNQITDVNYFAPTFAVMLVIAYSFHATRLPYNIMILASGHFKQTQHIYLTVAIINIVVSVAVVNLYGLVGVAIGTLVALGIQSIWQAIYVSKVLIQRHFRVFIKQFLVDISIAVLSVLSTKAFTLHSVSYLAWGIMALQVLLVVFVISVSINTIFYRNKMSFLLVRINRKLNSIVRK